MTLHALIDTLSYIECLACALSLSVLVMRREFSNYVYVALFIAVRLVSNLVMVVLVLDSHHHRLHCTLNYKVYFDVYWISYALEACLLLFAVYGIYRLAMAPLRGLQVLGTLIFRWAAAISLAVSGGLAFGPHVGGIRFAIRIVTQMQQTSSILTLCLLLFVTFAVRPMGLSFRSRIFGTTVGLSLLAATNLLVSAWMVGNKQIYSPMNLLNGLAVCGSFVVWTVYFALPEPRRRLIVLPTTSPFLRWNQISQALGDEPGFVAVAGVPPEMFADAEIEVMKRASRKMIDFPDPASSSAR